MKSFPVYFIFSFLFLLSSFSIAQRGKDGAATISTATVVNEYVRLTANASAGSSSIKVQVNTLNANGRFPGNLAAGDLILIMQIQGASLSAQDSNQWNPWETPRDSSWGMINNYNNCGNWEFAEVASIPTNVDINLDCPLINNYTATSRVVVVRVPRYSSLTINNGGSIACDAWNGLIGGICAIEVLNNTTINAGGSIDVSGNGFRGAALLENLSSYGINEAAQKSGNAGAEKGEGVVGYQAAYDNYGGRYGKGSPANGGGGGNDHNGGGGGGANAGDTSLWNGNGNPDNTIAGWTAAWNLQWAGFSANTSSGGGRGGYTFSANNHNATTTGPNNAAWGGDLRRTWGGYGGRPLDYSTGRLFLGGGGGSGDQDNNAGGSGGNGSGLIYIMNYGTISGSGTIVSNGSNGNNSGIDGGGGAGAGGTIVLNSVGAISGISVTANGGVGGNQVVGALVTEAEGPGGGGGGGYIAISNGILVRTANGGANGTTNSHPLSQFIPNGATIGGAGINNASVTNFIINSPNVTICAGQSVTLNATLSGTIPNGTTIIWYDSIVAGNIIGNGNTYVTPVLTSGTYTYYVGTCPGTYHQSVIVTVTNTAIASAGSDATICSGGNTTLNASGGTIYVWSPITGLSNPNISNPVANPASTTTYVVTVTSSCGTANDTVVVTVNSSLSASISGNTTICSGSPTTLTASGGGNYSWNTSATTSSISVTPTTNTTYSVLVTSGSCSTTATATVTVTNGINATINGPTAVCTGNGATLTASGGGNYSWTTGATTSVISVTPTANTTYSVIVSSGICIDTTSITVNVGSSIAATIGGITTICHGSSTTLTASGGTGFSWNTGATTASITVMPTTNTSYSVIVSSGNCSDTASITVHVYPGMNVAISGATNICKNMSIVLTASGGGNYVWNPGGQTTSSITVSPISTTVYTVTVTDNNGCKDSANTAVIVSPGVTATISANTTICSGSSTTLTSSGGTNYSWSTGATNPSIAVSPTTTSQYSVTVSNGLCWDTASVIVSVVPSPTLTITNNSTICLGDAVTLAATGGTNYSWSNGTTAASFTVNPVITTTYFVTTNNGACSDTASVIVTVSPAPNTTISGTGICQGDAATITALGGGTTYLWSNGATTATINPTTPGTYSVIATIGSCTDTASITLNVNPNPTATVNPPITIIQGQSANLTATGGTIYVWDNVMNGDNISVSPLTTTYYCVTVYDGNNCQDSACTEVIVELCANAGTLYLPNAFSPNGDGDNDALQIYYGIPDCIKSLHIEIYNRWGEKVFESSDPAFKWDGIYTHGLLRGNQTAGTEVFVYYLNVEIVDGSKVSKKGNVSLIR